MRTSIILIFWVAAGAGCKDYEKPIASSDSSPETVTRAFSKEFLVETGFKDVGQNQLRWNGVKCSHALRTLDFQVTELERGIGSDTFAPSYHGHKFGWRFLFNVIPETPMENSRPIYEEELPDTLVDIIAMPN